jgi:hypothetical protein
MRLSQKQFHQCYAARLVSVRIGNPYIRRCGLSDRNGHTIMYHSAKMIGVMFLLGEV